MTLTKKTGVVPDLTYLFAVSRLVGITPYTLPTFTLSTGCVLWGVVLIAILGGNLAFFLHSKIVVYDIDFVSQNLSLVGLTTYSMLAIVQSARAHTRVAKIFRKLNKTDARLKCVGVEVPSCGRHVNRHLVCLFGVLLLHQGPDFLIWLTGQYEYHVSYFAAVVYCQAVRLLSELHCVAYLHQVCVRLRLINVRLRACAAASSKLIFVRDFHQRAASGSNHEVTREMKLLLRVHNSLCGVAQLTSDVFAVQLLLSVASCFAYITSNLYYLSVTLLKINSPEDSNRGYRKLVFLLFCSYWIVVTFLELLLIVTACERPVKAAERTAEICHDLQVKERLPHLHTELQAFSDLLEYQKITLTCCDLFPLDNTLIYSIIGGAATYCVIIIQFGYK